MKIIVCGPPHSGKSVFSRWLKNMLPTEGVIMLDASPDGESMWSNSPDVEEVKEVTFKTSYSDLFVEDRINNLKKHDERIVLVDVGGMLDREDIKSPYVPGSIDKIKKNNIKIFSQCDAFICISGDSKRLKAWYDFCTSEVRNEKTGKPLECIGIIHSHNPDTTENKEKKSTFEMTKDGYVEADMYCLKRNGQVPNDANLVLNQIAKKLLNMTKDEAKEPVECDVDGYELAKKAGVIRYVGQDPTKYCRKILFPRSRTKEIYDAINEQNFDDFISTGRPVRVGNIDNGRVVVAACQALRNWGKSEGKTGVQNIEVYDGYSMEFKPLREIEESDYPDEHFCLLKNSILSMNRIESLNATFLNIDIYGDLLTRDDYLSSFQMPQINDGKVLFISGKIPHYLLASICLSSKANTIYTFTPGNGYTCVKHDGKEEEHYVGRIIKNDKNEKGDEIGNRAIKEKYGIDTMKFFRDRRNGKLTGRGMDYIEKRFYTPEQLEKLEALNVPTIEANRLIKPNRKVKTNSGNAQKEKTVTTEELKVILESYDIELLNPELLRRLFKPLGNGLWIVPTKAQIARCKELIDNQRKNQEKSQSVITLKSTRNNSKNKRNRGN